MKKGSGLDTVEDDADPSRTGPASRLRVVAVDRTQRDCELTVRTTRRENADHTKRQADRLKLIADSYVPIDT